MVHMASNLETGQKHGAVPDSKRRGLNVYTMSEIINVSGNNKNGERLQVQVQIPTFILSPFERESMVRMNSYLLGIVTSRMNRISALEWQITRKTKEEDRLAEELKSLKQIYSEYDDAANIKHLVLRRKLLIRIQEELPEVKDDLSNFDMALRRWNKTIKIKNKHSADEIENWLNTINSEDDFEEFQKKWIFDLMVHGAGSLFKQNINGLLENCYILPGGSIYPIRSRYVGSSTGYVQMLSGYEPKVYFNDEVLFDAYIPISARSYGLIPLEALINKVSESLLFDKLAADRADGTKPPEKLVVLGEQSKMFGDLSSLGGGEDYSLPVDLGEQKRVETIVNEERHNAVRVISGVGHPIIADISKADTFTEQSERQTKLIRDIGFVFNMSPFELSLGGSDFVAGKETSGNQAKQEKEKGIYPLIRIIDKTVGNRFLPFKFGSGWLFEHKTELGELELAEVETKKMGTGTYSTNQIREDRGDEPYPEEEYNRPPGNNNNNEVGGSDINPMFTREA